MFVKNIRECSEFIANDGCLLRELLHPDNEPLDLPYSLAMARVAPGKQSCRHVLKQAEVYYILDGSGLMHIDKENEVVISGDMIHIPPGAEQWIENTGEADLLFLALVSPPWTAADDTRLN